MDVRELPFIPSSSGSNGFIVLQLKKTIRKKINAVTVFVKWSFMQLFTRLAQFLKLLCAILLCISWEIVIYEKLSILTGVQKRFFLITVSN